MSDTPDPTCGFGVVFFSMAARLVFLAGFFSVCRFNDAIIDSGNNANKPNTWMVNRIFFMFIYFLFISDAKLTW